MEIYIGRGSFQIGSFTVDQLIAALQGGLVKTTDLAWSDGEEKWKPLDIFAKEKGIELFPTQSGIEKVNNLVSKVINKDNLDKVTELANSTGERAREFANKVAPHGESIVNSVKKTTHNLIDSLGNSSNTSGEATPQGATESVNVTLVAPKSVALAYVLLFLFGSLGGHRFYLGRKTSAFALIGMSVGGTVLMLIGIPTESVFMSTLGTVMIIGMALWCLADIFLIPKMARSANYAPIAKFQVGRQ